MSGIEAQISSTILSKTFKKLKEHPLTNIYCTVGLIDKNNIYNWQCTLLGPNDSPYKGGYFQILIKFPIDFPQNGPEIIFNTPIFHLNVNPVKTKNEQLGHCCISTINFWNPETSIEDILVSVFGLFYAANEESAYQGYGDEAINDFINNKEAYDKRVRYFTKKYANGIYQNDNYQRWDFTYNE